MSGKRKSIEVKLDSDDAIMTSIAEKSKALEATERKRLNKANRRDNIFLGLSGLCYLVIAIALITRKNWGHLVLVMAMMTWVILVTLLNHQINYQRYTISMMAGLRDIENDALLQRVRLESKK